MAKAPKASVSAIAAAITPTLEGDKAIIVRDFATFGQFTVNNEARAALLRRVTDKETFEAIKIAACVAWLVQRQYTEALALEVMTEMRNPNSTIGKKPLRTAQQQIDYKRSLAAWQYYRECNGVADLTRAKSDKPKATRAPHHNETPAPLADNSAKAPPASLDSVVPVRGKLDVVVSQFVNIAALMGRTIQANVKEVTGDQGSALRALHIHCQNEMKRIQAMKG